MRRVVLAILVGICSLTVYAQQDAEYSMYMFNGLYLNPAYAGSQDQAVLNAIYRHQWAGVNGGPRSGTLSFHTPLKNDVHAIGAQLLFDRHGVSTLYTLQGMYAFRIPVSKRGKLALGVQFTNTYFQGKFSDIITPHPDQTDIAFSIDRHIYIPNIGFGVFYNSKKWYAGASVPHLLNFSLDKSVDFTGVDTTIARMYKHYNITAGYVFGKDDAKVKFKPSFLIKAAARSPLDVDLNLAVLIVDRFWIGGSYRLGGNRSATGTVGPGAAIVGMFECKLTKSLRVGYAHDFTLSNINKYQNGTHEIMLGYDFPGKNVRFVTPRYINYF